LTVVRFDTDDGASIGNPSDPNNCCPFVSTTQYVYYLKSGVQRTTRY
jgi:hypothetical protein